MPTFMVIISAEGQYALWPADSGPPPEGWRATGVDGVHQQHLDHIAQVWGVHGTIV
ncbi:MbtH family NRPS accessory protein [Acrocarpospora catenulata]|uniref:MbtH family NRPS accessory protein n=1 Tax=Acrocarpospora catenulata TaxID=2836182 RepID=UPI001BD9EB07|nr:MbtH family NRPS accessory protein [Acrocarpospora catenulata]